MKETSITFTTGKFGSFFDNGHKRVTIVCVSSYFGFASKPFFSLEFSVIYLLEFFTQSMSRKCVVLLANRWTR